MLQEINNYLNNGYYYRAEKKKEIAVLLIHGFAASPVEFIPFADYLKKDFDVYAPVLPGHKTNINDFSKQKYTDWLDFSEKIYFRLLEEYKKVVLVGFSMGGTISLYLSSKKAPYKIVTLSSPINFLDADFAKIILSDWKKTNMSLSMILYEIKQISKKESITDRSNPIKIKQIINNLYKKIIKEFNVENEDMKKYVDTYTQISYNSVKEIFKLTKHVKTQLSKVVSDILIIHSKEDYLIPLSNSKDILNGVHSNNIELFILEESGHQILLDKEHDLVFKKTKEFISRTL